ncbi:hypothetical protein ACFYNY_35825 [Streptomyces sp. NPDC006530]|uniref:hypothetical protein n=1 Tax=Streptomyces sp. NPDC006530 TaxID=3364750 RepID=UPI0036896B5D
MRIRSVLAAAVFAAVTTLVAAPIATAADNPGTFLYQQGERTGASVGHGAVHTGSEGFMNIKFTW